MSISLEHLYLIKQLLIWKMEINLHIIANNRSKPIYILKALNLNGKTLEKTLIRHSDIIEGGTLRIHNDRPTCSMGNKQTVSEPKTEIKDHIILPSPYIEKGDITFRGSVLK